MNKTQQQNINNSTLDSVLKARPDKLPVHTVTEIQILEKKNPNFCW